MTMPHIPTPAEALAASQKAQGEQRLAVVLDDLKRSNGRRATVSDTREVCEAVAAHLRKAGWAVHIGKRAGKRTDYRLTVGQKHEDCAGVGCEACENTGIVPR